MKKLVIVADDFGFTKGTNDGCIEALEKGILTDMAFMVDSPGSQDAGKRATEKGVIDHVGIHVTLNDLIRTGIYLRKDDYYQLLTSESSQNLQARVKEEFKKFEDSFEAFPAFLNSHKNIHQHEKLREIFAEYAQKHGLYIRRTEYFKDTNIVQEKTPFSANKYFINNGCKITDHIFEEVESTYENAFSGFLKKLSTVEDNTTTEILFHPAYLDDVMRQYTSMLEPRERDRKLLLDKNFRKAIEQLGFTIVPYKDLSEKQQQ